ncbi:CRM-domain containing factor CFM2, chloroplastic-like isoform X2 [Vigna unguiculata]|nr:CRM-domain containing factor CFM2, chloroplastic-like isoform X2 [Vigna unguiculata]
MDENDKGWDKRETHLSENNSVTYTRQSLNAQTAKPALIQGVGTPRKVRFQLPGEAELAKDADYLLTGIGPRFFDWWGYDPLPVDADLLPAVIPGYRKPFRLLPYGVKPKLTDDEMTTMRRLGKHLPCHFALGRNRKLQGLAVAIIKIWERCEIVKIAIKRGVENTDGEVMAEEIKYLTGGTLLARDKEFIVFYRGKDFLPAAVSSAIEQRRSIGMYKLKTGNSLSITDAPDLNYGTIEYDSEVQGMNFQKDTKPGILTEAEKTTKSTSIKLSMALEEKTKAEKLLAELENAESPQEEEMNREGITEEEKYMLRRIGLKMGPFLLLGRRGVFDGTVENMHLHWKYRELVKIICNKCLEDVQQIAQTLAAESGGILIAVERLRKGHAIIVYRGKNYSRPASLRPRTLLNKREALKRSKEAQRRQSLKLHVLKLGRNIDRLKLQMAQDMEANSPQTPVDNQQAIKEQRIELSDSYGAHQVEPGNSINWNSPHEPSVDNRQAIQEQSVGLVDGGGALKSEADNFINWNPTTETSVDNPRAMQGQPVELIDNSEAHQGEPEISANWKLPEEAPVDNQEAIQDQPVELVDGGGALKSEADNFINWNPTIETSVDNPRAMQGQSVELIDNGEAHQGEPEISANWNLPEEAPVDNQEAIQDQPVDLIDGGGAHQDRPVYWPGVIPKNTVLDGVSDSVDGVSINKVMESSVISSKSDADLSALVRDMSSNELPSGSVYLSNKERLLLRKQALTMKKRSVLSVGKSNSVTGIAKAINAHFRKYPLAVVNVKGRAKGTSVQEVVSKLEQATGAVLVSQELHKVILYRGWGEGEQPSTAINVNKLGQEGAAKPSVSPELWEAIRIECGLQ